MILPHGKLVNAFTLFRQVVDKIDVMLSSTNVHTCTRIHVLIVSFKGRNTISRSAEYSEASYLGCCHHRHRA